MPTAYVGGHLDDRAMHHLDEIALVEDAVGRIRAKWICACRRTGSGRTMQAAKAGWRRHARIADAREMG
ncbi:hypothetical protein BFN01_04345 [Microbacterium sp. AR7-10]|nr:hypothetical protein BFN01_04345 [Microbacterium sp. AR7-10]